MTDLPMICKNVKLGYGIITNVSLEAPHSITIKAKNFYSTMAFEKDSEERKCCISEVSEYILVLCVYNMTI